MSQEPRLVTLGVLEQDKRCLLQLRDDLPHILYPGFWGLFGGHLEPGESPEEGFIREIYEEIGYPITKCQQINCYADREATRYIFYTPLTVPLTALNLNEGQDLALADRETIASGYCYSLKLDQVRPLGDIHQRILLDFFSERL